MKSLTVVKIGGELALPDVVGRVWEGIARAGRVVVVHGGGIQANRVAGRLGHTPRMVEGRRVTTDVDLDIALWTMRGEVNARLVAAGHAAGMSAVGLSGADAALVQVRRRPPWQIDGEAVDFGWVGDVEKVDPAVLNTLLDAGHVPVVASLGVDALGALYNVNADTVAGEIAVALGADAMQFVTSVGGVRQPGRDDVLPHCDPALHQLGLKEKWIDAGMKVKLHVAFGVLSRGVADVRIVGIDDVGQTTGGTRVSEAAA